jgi:hypothetical protein
VATDLESVSESDISAEMQDCAEVTRNAALCENLPLEGSSEHGAAISIALLGAFALPLIPNAILGPTWVNGAGVFAGPTTAFFGARTLSYCFSGTRAKVVTPLKVVPSSELDEAAASCAEMARIEVDAARPWADGRTTPVRDLSLNVIVVDLKLYPRVSFARFSEPR